MRDRWLLNVFRVNNARTHVHLLSAAAARHHSPISATRRNEQRLFLVKSIGKEGEQTHVGSDANSQRQSAEGATRGGRKPLSSYKLMHCSISLRRDNIRSRTSPSKRGRSRYRLLVENRLSRRSRSAFTNILTMRARGLAVKPRIAYESNIDVHFCKRECAS